MKIGFVILTRKYPALLRLHLAAAKRYLNPLPPILVRHDGPDFSENELIARSVSLDFDYGVKWRGQKAILLGWASAIKWGLRKELDVVVMAARRYIPLWNWVPTVRENIIIQGAVLERAAGEGLGVLRNEFAALNVNRWVKAIDYLKNKGDSGETGAINAMFECRQAANLAAGLPVGIHHPNDIITPWPEAINGDRFKPPQNRTLWHYYSPVSDYLDAAHELGLTDIQFQDLDVRDRKG
jgi:hypothetical protein